VEPFANQGQSNKESGEIQKDDKMHGFYRIFEGECVSARTPSHPCFSRFSFTYLSFVHLLK